MCGGKALWSQMQNSVKVKKNVGSQGVEYFNSTLELMALSTLSTLMCPIQNVCNAAEILEKISCFLVIPTVKKCVNCSTA
jgi:hypothetical protein